MNYSRKYLKESFVAWEALRLLYITTLILIGVFIPTDSKRLVANNIGMPYWVIYAIYVVVANAFYGLGPLGEALLYAVFGRRMGAWRFAIFALGFLFAFFWTGGHQVLPHL